MPFHSFPTGIIDSPMVKSVFVQNYSIAGDFPPPPASEFRITDISQQRVIDDGNKRITD